MATWFILLWVVELGALWIAAIYAGLIQAQVTYLEEYDHSDHLRSSIMFNTIAFYGRAIVVSVVVLINLGSCSSPGLARAVQGTLCCGDMWSSSRSRQARNTCLGVYWLIEQISFALPALSLLFMSNNGISGVLSKQCLQQGDAACDSSCAFRYAPWDSFSNVKMEKLFQTNYGTFCGPTFSTFHPLPFASSVLSAFTYACKPLLATMQRVIKPSAQVSNL